MIMARSIIYTLLVALLTTPLFSETPELLMKKANEAYIDESYHKAIDLYERITGMEVESAVLYYNLGNAYHKTGQYAKAILNYERALRLNPSDDNIQHNLRVSRARIGDRSEPIPRLFFIEWHDSILQLQSVDGWAITAIVFITLFSLFVALLFIMKNRIQKQIFLAASVFMLLLFLISLYGANRQYERHYSVREAIVMTPRVTAKSAPSESAVDVFVIHEGRKLEITGELNDWYEVRLPDGNIGWIRRSAATVI